MLSMLVKNFNRPHFEIFSYFSQKIGFLISCLGDNLHEVSNLIFGEKIRKISSFFHLLNSFPGSSDFCSLLITFANSFDSDQVQQNIGPDLDPNCLTLLILP